MATPAFPSIDAYLAAQPESARTALGLVRQAVRRALPEAEESISYQIPTYKLNGRAVFYFAGWKKHFSLYPVSDALLAAFPELSRYEISKGTLRFPLAEPVPEDLIERLARFRAEEARGAELT
jgi:uncharacterized protein YdhG (YjbR/CyaY superfamily)